MKKVFRAVIVAMAVVGAMTTAAVAPAVAVGPAEISSDQVQSIAVKHTMWSEPVTGGYIQLRYGNYGDTQYAWARIDGAEFPHGIVILERSWDGGSTWYEFGAVSTTVRNFTNGFRTSPDSQHVMRACWDPGPKTCTNSW